MAVDNEPEVAELKRSLPTLSTDQLKRELENSESALRGLGSQWAGGSQETSRKRKLASSGLVDTSDRRHTKRKTRQEAFSHLVKTKGRLDRLTSVKRKRQRVVDPNVYCLCKQNATDYNNEPMIQCDDCKEWYHLKCVKLDTARANKIKDYMCLQCQEERGLLAPAHGVGSLKKSFGKKRGHQDFSSKYSASLAAKSKREAQLLALENIEECKDLDEDALIREMFEVQKHMVHNNHELKRSLIEQAQRQQEEELRKQFAEKMARREERYGLELQNLRGQNKLALQAQQIYKNKADAIKNELKQEKKLSLAAREDTQDKLKALRTDHADKNKVVTDLRKKLKKQKEKHAKEKKSWEEHVAEAGQKSNKALEAAKRKRKELQAKLQKEQDDKEELQREHDQAEAQKTDLEAKLRKEELRKTDLERTLEEEREKNADLAKELTKKTQKLRTLKDEVQKQRRNNEERLRRGEENDRKLEDQYKAKLDEAKREKKDLEKQIRSLEKNSQTLKTSIANSDQLRATYRTLQIQLKESQKKNSTLQSEAQMESQKAEEREEELKRQLELQKQHTAELEKQLSRQRQQAPAKNAHHVTTNHSEQQYPPANLQPAAGDRPRLPGFHHQNTMDPSRIALQKSPGLPASHRSSAASASQTHHLNPPPSSSTAPWHRVAGRHAEPSNTHHNQPPPRTHQAAPHRHLSLGNLTTKQHSSLEVPNPSLNFKSVSATATPVPTIAHQQKKQTNRRKRRSAPKHRQNPNPFIKLRKLGVSEGGRVLWMLKGITDKPPSRRQPSPQTGFAGRRRRKNSTPSPKNVRSPSPASSWLPRGKKRARAESPRATGTGFPTTQKKQKKVCTVCHSKTIPQRLDPDQRLLTCASEKCKHPFYHRVCIRPTPSTHWLKHNPWYCPKCAGAEPLP